MTNTEARTDNTLWKKGRKPIQPLVSPQAIQAHLPLVEEETTQLLHDVIRSPDIFHPYCLTSPTKLIKQNYRISALMYPDPRSLSYPP